MAGIIAGRAHAKGALVALQGDVGCRTAVDPSKLDGSRSWMAARPAETISVGLPALNEGKGRHRRRIGDRTAFHAGGGLVDERIRLDSGSTDDTEIRGIAAGGAASWNREQALPEIAPRRGQRRGVCVNGGPSADISGLVDYD